MNRREARLKAAAALSREHGPADAFPSDVSNGGACWHHSVALVDALEALGLLKLDEYPIDKDATVQIPCGYQFGPGHFTPGSVVVVKVKDAIDALRQFGLECRAR